MLGPCTWASHNKCRWNNSELQPAAGPCKLLQWRVWDLKEAIQCLQQVLHEQKLWSKRHTPPPFPFSCASTAKSAGGHPQATCITFRPLCCSLTTPCCCCCCCYHGDDAAGDHTPLCMRKRAYITSVGTGGLVEGVGREHGQLLQQQGGRRTAVAAQRQSTWGFG